MPFHVFISYAQVDALLAGAICSSLEARGLSTWIAERDVEYGDRFAQAISEALQAASAMVVVLTEASAQSTHVANEVATAGERERPIPVFVYRASEVELPPTMRRYCEPSGPYLARVPDEERIAELVDAIAATRASASSASVSAATPAQPEVAREVRHATCRHFRAALIGLAAVVAFGSLGDLGLFVEEWFPNADTWLEPLDGLDLEGYVPAMTLIHAGLMFFLASVLRAWTFGIRLAQVLEASDVRGLGALLGHRVFSLRQWFQPATTVGELVTLDVGDRSRWARALWWPCVLASTAAAAVGALLGAWPEWTPAIVALALFTGSHVLALIGFALLLRLCDAVRTSPAHRHSEPPLAK